ncbi:MAG: glycosyltransferase family 4 protein [Candidatus Thermoplasmatota archaeon]|nr:glycosyltransferase family 4 protein [Candidatus Thermoplasmatota archaeon]
MKRVLMVAYHFPPLDGGGIHRTIKFAKYLPTYGWEPHIITAHLRNAQEKDVRPKELPDDVHIHRAFAPNQFIPGKFNKTSYLLLRPEPTILWKQSVLKLSTELARKQKFSVVYTTSGPHSAHLIGIQIKKKTGLSLVADFRDPWTQRVVYDYPSKLHYDLDLRWEKKVAKEADILIHNTETLRNNFIKLHPNAADKSVVIPNGYDPEDFEGVTPSTRQDEHFVISYIGSVYPDLEHIFSALSNAFLERPEIREHIKLDFIGYNTPAPLAELARKSGLENNIRILPPVPHQEAVKKMVDSDALLHFLPATKGIEGVPGQKIYEYLASGTPILGIFPEGAEVRKLVSLGERNVCADLNNPKEIADAVILAYENWKKYGREKRQIMPDAYNRKLLTKRLAGIFDELAR